jgi:hypothetical protein
VIAFAVAELLIVALFAVMLPVTVRFPKEALLPTVEITTQLLAEGESLGATHSVLLAVLYQSCPFNAALGGVLSAKFSSR